MVDKIISQVQFEIGQIDHLLERYAPLFERIRHSQPDLVEVTAIASVLHSFYNSIENIFLAIAKGVDLNVPTGSQWHRDLLTNMSRHMPSREPVLSTETAQRLADYLGFRHFYRHSYSFILDWEELERLASPLAEVWEQVKAELELFLSSLSKE